MPGRCPGLRTRLDEILDTNLADDVLSWELAPDGEWHKIETVAGVNAQARLRELAIERAQDPHVTVPEREIKLAAPPTGTLPPFSDPLAGVVAEPAGTRHLVATYYDTDDLRPGPSGGVAPAPQRRGLGGEDPRPAPTTTGSSDRATYAFTGDEGDPPAEALDLIRAFTRTAPVTAVARLRTTRARRAAPHHAGQPDRRGPSTTTSSWSAATRPVRAFRELEIEVAVGAPEAQTTAIVARFRAAGAGAPDPTPKIVRGVGSPRAEPSDLEAAPEAAHGLREVVSDAFRASAAKLVSHDAGVRQGTDAEELHQARVATRRLRATCGPSGPSSRSTGPTRAPSRPPVGRRRARRGA